MSEDSDTESDSDTGVCEVEKVIDTVTDAVPE